MNKSLKKNFTKLYALWLEAEQKDNKNYIYKFVQLAKDKGHEATEIFNFAVSIENGQTIFNKEIIKKIVNEIFNEKEQEKPNE